MTHIVSFSGGMGSFLAAEIVARKYGAENTLLLQAETYVEHDDLYRFAIEGARLIFGERFYSGAPLLEMAAFIPPPTVMKERKLHIDAMRLLASKIFPAWMWIAEGRTPWEVQEDKRIIANSQIDPCSDVLKRRLLDKFVKASFTPENCCQYVGIDWTEEHRLVRLAARRAPYKVRAPLCEDGNRIQKHNFAGRCRALGVEPPAIYALGFAHNNCNGECVKAGQAAWALKLKSDRGGYIVREEWEQKMRAIVGPYSHIGVSVRGEKKRALTLRELRERIEKGEEIDGEDFGGCGCAL